MSSSSPTLRDDFYKAVKQAVAKEVHARSKGAHAVESTDLTQPVDDINLEISPDLPADQKQKVMERALYAGRNRIRLL